MSDQPNPSETTAIVADLFKKAGDLPNPTPEEKARREEAREKRSLEMIAEHRRADARRRFEISCPTDYRVSDWSHPKLGPYLPQIQKVRNHQIGEKGLMAYGESGRGKSRAMWALMERLCCQEGREVRMFTAAEWFGEMQERVKYGHDDARGWVEAVARRPLVFIDDFGQEALIASKTDWALSWFFRFLDIRVGEKLPLFLTTNLSSREMAVKGGSVRGDPMVRRLLEVCEVVVF